MPAEPAKDATDLLAALIAVRHLRETLTSWEPELIAAARDRGVSWAALAPALGVTSRQAAERRYLRLRPAAERTGEGRVRAERDRRAGDRAVSEWARKNSAILRQLAGQVSALENLGRAAQARVDQVQQALSHDDPARLLTPLADTEPELPSRHAALARRIRSVTEHSERVRRETLDRRLR